MSRRLIIAGGGTGGHLYPGIAVAQYVKDKDVDCFFIVSDRGLERRVLTGLGYDFYEQKQTPLKNVSLVTRMKSVMRLIKEFGACWKRIHKTDMVLLTGGFASGAAAAVAVIKGVPLYMHEQNSVMGLTNRIFAGRCKKVFLSFPETLNVKGDTVVAGNPVRGDFTSIAPLEKAGKRILVLGGSQGSRKVNTLVAEAADTLIKMGYSITHQTGGALLEETKEMYRKAGLAESGRVVITGYIDDVAGAMADADIVMARSGSGTVFEVANAGRYAVYVPFARAADNHQYYNALYAEKMGIAKVITEDEAKASKIIETIEDYEKHSDLYIEALKSAKKYKSAEIIAGGMNIG